jgi:hypothetical protein
LFLVDDVIISLSLSKHIDFCSKVEFFVPQLGSVLVSLDVCNALPNRYFVEFGADCLKDVKIGT